MTILQRYIAKTIILTTILITAIMVSVVFLIELLGELKSLGNGDYGVLEVLWYALLCLPNELYQFSPILVLMGSLVALSILSSHRELAVMRASGFAVKNVIFSVLCAALIVIMAMTVMGEWLGPNLSYKAEIYKQNAQNADQAIITSMGTWLHIDHDFIHVQNVVDKTVLEDVTRYQFDDKHNLQATYFAKRLALQKNHWQMFNVMKTTFYNERTKSQFFTKLPLNLKFNANLLTIGAMDPSQMSLAKLANFGHYLEHNGLQAKEYQYSFWQRIFQPLASLVMILLAIPFVLGTLTMPSLGFRIIIGLTIGFSFFIMNALLGQLSIVYQLPTMLAALFPPLLFAVFALILSKRLIRR